MKSYVTLELEVMLLECEDVITSSQPDFKDAETGDNGVWFPGSSGGTSNWTGGNS